MAKEPQTDTEGRRKSLFSESERAGFRKQEQDTTLAPEPAKPGRSAKSGQPGKHPENPKVPAAPGQTERSGIGFHRKKEPSPVVAEGPNREPALDARSYRVIWLGIIVVVSYFATLILPDYIFDVNNTNLSPAWFFEILQRNFSNLVTFVSGGGAYGGVDFTMIRLVIIGLAGASLAVSGAALQGSLKNQLASPSTLGVMQGAQFGGMMFLILATMGVVTTSSGGAEGATLLQQYDSTLGQMNIIEYIWAVWQQSFFSLAGSALVVGIVLFVSWLAGHGRSSRVALIVSGQVVAALIGSFSTVVRLYVQEYGTGAQIDALSSIMAGGFDTTFTLPSLVVVGVPLLACIAVVILMRNRLNLLAFDEMEARSMGISTRGLKIGLVACCTIMTAVVVAFCGPVGYVGFLIPHLARRIVGPDFKYLVPASALLGASFLIIVYYLFMCFSIPAGSLSTVTSALGVVAFVVVVFQQRRSGNASW